jgi:hypothetical protein
MAALALAAGATTGCGEVVCGDGTYEVNGECRPVDTTLQIVKCGMGFKVSAGKCVPSDDWAKTVCGPYTEYDPKQGLCIGKGGPTAACTDPKFKCQAPSGSNVCISGRAFEAASFIEKQSEATPIKLKAENLKITVYDPMNFASDPNNTKPLATATEVDDDGCFIVPKVTIPFAQFFAVAVEDAGATDKYALAGYGMPATLHTNIENVGVPAFEVATVAAWSAEIGGTDLLTAGAAFIQYHTPSKLVDGVIPLQQQKEPKDWGTGNGEAFYMTGTSAAPFFDKTATGTKAIGTVVIRGAPVTTYGGKKDNCTVEERLAGSAPGALLFVKFSANGSGC